MTAFKNILNGNAEYEYFKERLKQQVFPNLFKLVRVTITLPAKLIHLWNSLIFGDAKDQYIFKVYYVSKPV
jgi:hypothetical protein